MPAATGSCRVALRIPRTPSRALAIVRAQCPVHYRGPAATIPLAMDRVRLEMKFWTRSALLLSMVGYVISVDWCLIINSVPSPFRSYSVLGLGFILQAICFVTLTTLIMWTG